MFTASCSVHLCLNRIVLWNTLFNCKFTWIHAKQIYSNSTEYVRVCAMCVERCIIKANCDAVQRKTTKFHTVYGLVALGPKSYFFHFKCSVCNERQQFHIFFPRKSLIMSVNQWKFIIKSYFIYLSGLARTPWHIGHRQFPTNGFIISIKREAQNLWNDRVHVEHFQSTDLVP